MKGTVTRLLLEDEVAAGCPSDQFPDFFQGATPVCLPDAALFSPVAPLPFASLARGINKAAKIVREKNFKPASRDEIGRRPGRRGSARQEIHDYRSTPVYRKEGKVVVETNSEIEPGGGGSRARLYLEREEDVQFRGYRRALGVPAKAGKSPTTGTGGFSRGGTPQGGSLPLRPAGCLCRLS